MADRPLTFSKLHFPLQAVSFVHAKLIHGEGEQKETGSEFATRHFNLFSLLKQTRSDMIKLQIVLQNHQAAV